MNDRDHSQPATDFERLRPYLLRVAYSHLGSLDDALDVVQEAWLRLQRSGPDQVHDLRAWLTTVVARLSLDELTSARARRERYVGTWLPEPIVNSLGQSGDPSERVCLDESVSMALLIILESLSPAERCAFLLHDVFDYSLEEVAGILGRSLEATRQLAARGRRSVQARQPRHAVGADEQRRVVTAFLAACQSGKLETLIELLDPEVVFRSDGGGLVPAARTIFTGAERVARIAAALARKRPLVGAQLVPVNGASGLMIESEGVLSIVAFTVSHGRISEINVMRNPTKLRHLRAARQ